MKLSVQTYSLVQDFGAEKAFRMIREAGFEAVDWNVDEAWNIKKIAAAERLENLTVFDRSPEAIEEFFREELDAIRANGLTVTQAHAPFPCFPDGRADILEYAIGCYQNLILFLDRIGCRHVVIHGLSKGRENDAIPQREFDRLNLHLYESLIPTLQKTTQIKVCMENLYRSADGFGFMEGVCCDPHVTAEWIDALNAKAGRECFGLCLDTGHINLIRKTFFSYLPVLGKRIACLHIHDNAQDADSHWMPYAGTTRWKDFLDGMREIGYTGDLSFETYNHTTTNRIPPELSPVFLRTIAEIGDYFRKQIQS